MFDHFTQFHAVQGILGSLHQEFAYSAFSVEPPALLECLPLGLIEDQV
jgi:hypothetical protein